MDQPKLGDDEYRVDQPAAQDNSPPAQTGNKERSKRRKRKVPANKAASKGNVFKNRDGTGVSVQLADLPVITSKRWYVTLSAAIAILGAIVSGTYFVIDYGRIKPIETQLEETQTLLANSKTDFLSAKSQLERSEQKASVLAANLTRPEQIFPPDRSSIVGFNVSFSWDYAKHDASSKYILELFNLATPDDLLKLNVDRPETKSMFYAFDRLAAGSYLWRVRPGVIVSGQEVAQGPWSLAAVFTIHPNVTERIRSTGKILVATTPTSYDPFVGVNNLGQYQGFELKLLRWLMPRIAEKLQLNQTPTLEIAEVPWNELFTYMQNGEADIAVHSITRSEAREKEYQNLKFTTGYVVNHQIFVQLTKDGVFPDSLKGRSVGAKSRSVNESVAKFLAPTLGYTVNSSYTAYGDLFDGLRRGEIAYAVVDSSLVSEALNKSIYPLGGFLDNKLRPFYKRELGFDHEEYSILVHEGGSSELRTALNAILASAEYKAFASSLHVEPPSN
jgi:ABC-type amino acid transport substrate-binding protein